MLNRRNLIMVLGTTAFAVPYSSAQQHPGKPPHIGWLVPTTQAEWYGLLMPTATLIAFLILQRNW
jgi:hypothetical protein